MKLFNLLDTQYNKFTQSIKSYLSNTLGSKNTNYGNTTIFGQLVNVVSAAMHNLILYIEDAFTEQNVYTAQRKKSIYNLARLSGYQPDYGKAAGVELKLDFVTSNNNLDIILNNKEPLTCTQNGLQYNLVLPQESVVMSIGEDNSSKYIYAVQGLFQSQSFVAAGGYYYTQNFKFYGNVDIAYLEVFVNNEQWGRVASIYDMDPDAKQFVVSVGYQDGIDIVFGNTTNGRKIEDGDVIKINYLVHDGEEGNIDVSNETYFIFNNNLKDLAGNIVDGNTIFNIAPSNKDSVTSGTDAESKEKVRNMIGLNSRSLVLASTDNYKELINKFSFCGYNRTWSEPGTMEVKSIIMNNYKIILNSNKTYFDLTENDFKLTNTQKSSIYNFIKNNGSQMAGVSYTIIDPDICKYAMYLYIKLKNKNSDQIYIKSKIRNLIAEFFADESFGDLYIPKSDIINLIKENISEIDGVNVYFLSERNETALQTKHYISESTVYDPTTGMYKKSQEDVYLFDNENPNLGLDEHGNIYLEDPTKFPVLMGGWDYLNNNSQEVRVCDPLQIIIE